MRDNRTHRVADARIFDSLVKTKQRDAQLARNSSFKSFERGASRETFDTLRYSVTFTGVVFVEVQAVFANVQRFGGFCFPRERSGHFLSRERSGTARRSATQCTKWCTLDLTYCGDHPSAVNCRRFREFERAFTRCRKTLPMTDVEHERDDSPRLRRHVKLHSDAIIQSDSAFSLSLSLPTHFYPAPVFQTRPSDILDGEKKLSSLQQIVEQPKKRA